MQFWVKNPEWNSLIPSRPNCAKIHDIHEWHLLRQKSRVFVNLKFSNCPYLSFVDHKTNPGFHTCQISFKEVQNYALKNIFSTTTVKRNSWEILSEGMSEQNIVKMGSIVYLSCFKICGTCYKISLGIYHFLCLNRD